MLPGDLAVVVSVDVDESGGDDAAPGVYLFRAAPAILPIDAIRPPATATSASKGSFPVPSTTMPPRMIRSNSPAIR